MGQKPSYQYSIDRIDVDGDYSPSNCRWADKQTQSINQRVKQTNKSGVSGVHYARLPGKWCARIGIGGKRLHLGYFDTLDEAIMARQAAVNKYYTPILECQDHQCYNIHNVQKFQS